MVDVVSPLGDQEYVPPVLVTLADNIAELPAHIDVEFTEVVLEEELEIVAEVTTVHPMLERVITL